MSQTWSIFSAVTLLLVQLCIGKLYRRLCGNTLLTFVLACKVLIKISYFLHWCDLEMNCWTWLCLPLGEKSCAIWSSAGRLVQRGTSFKMYCTFHCRCRGSMYSDHPPTLQSHKELNSTTIYFNVVNITKNRTYSCQCNCHPALDPCGLDISTGCEYEVKRHYALSETSFY